MKKALALFLFVNLLAGPGKAQTTSGWIPFELPLYQICFPVLVNGHPANARLFNAVPSGIDKDFATAIGLTPTEKPAVNIQLGALLLQEPVAAGVFLHAAATPPNDVRLGEEVFKQCIVDIDFPNHAIAFYSPAGFSPPAGAVALAFTRQGDDRAVPIRVEDGPEKYYWVYLGDPTPLSLYDNFFGPLGILNNRPVSVRQGGGPKKPPEAVATIHELRLAGSAFKEIPAVLPADSVSGPHPAGVGGHIGVGLLNRFRVIVDYAHDRLYLIPGAASMVNAPFARDRSGLVLRKTGQDYLVTFVCPGSPALKAGFRLGDTVTMVDARPLPALQGVAWQTASHAKSAIGRSGVFRGESANEGRRLADRLFDSAARCRCR